MYQQWCEENKGEGEYFCDTSTSMVMQMAKCLSEESRGNGSLVFVVPLGETSKLNTQAPRIESNRVTSSAPHSVSDFENKFLRNIELRYSATIASRLSNISCS